MIKSIIQLINKQLQIAQLQWMWSMDLVIKSTINNYFWCFCNDLITFFESYYLKNTFITFSSSFSISPARITSGPLTAYSITLTLGLRFSNVKWGPGEDISLLLSKTLLPPSITLPTAVPRLKLLHKTDANRWFCRRTTYPWGRSGDNNLLAADADIFINLNQRKISNSMKIM